MIFLRFLYFFTPLLLLKRERPDARALMSDVGGMDTSSPLGPARAQVGGQPACAVSQISVHPSGPLLEHTVAGCAGSDGRSRRAPTCPIPYRLARA